MDTKRTNRKFSCCARRWARCKNKFQTFLRRERRIDLQRGWLKAPYIFQNLQPGPNGPDNRPYDGAKTLLDMHTSGFGSNAQMGMVFRATTNLQFGLAYQSETRVNTTGGASGDPYAQFNAPPGSLAFHYDISVRNIFPQEASAGVSWKFHPQWRLALQILD